MSSSATSSAGPTSVSLTVPTPASLPNSSAAVQSWQKLSPAEFKQLQEYASYSTKCLKDILPEFEGEGCLSAHKSDDDTIGYDGFKHFLDLYLEADVPADLSKHLFMSFIKRLPSMHNMATAKSDQGPITNAIGMVGQAAVVPVAPTAPGPSGSSTAGTGAGSGSAHDTMRSISEKLQETKQKVAAIVAWQKPSTSAGVTQSEPAAVAGGHKLLEKSGSGTPNTNNSLHSRQSSRRSHQSTVTSSSDEPAKITKTLAMKSARSGDLSDAQVSIKDIVCYLSLLEGCRPEDKLQFVFHLYDSDGNGMLDSSEMEMIIEQMMSVAQYLEWDTVELEPILREMMDDIDIDKDGVVTLDEWTHGGLNTVPLLVLLGFDTNMKEDGSHLWKLRHFRKTAYCNVCCERLIAWGGKQGLSCTLCKYTVHERCAAKAPANCISTYSKTKRSDDNAHHWVPGNCTGRCAKCKKSVKAAFDGQICRWCKATVHIRCASAFKPECNFGPLSYHILPPKNICPFVVGQGSVRVCGRKESMLYSQPQSFHITPSPETRPLIVFINPKSGGRQGERLFKKFQYMLNPRQVFDLSKGGPMEGLLMYAGVKVNILCCGGDGTVGWVLEAMDKVTYEQERPSVAVLPLGTGNDLARCIRWGGGYENEDLGKILYKIEKSSCVMLDRWEVRLLQTDPSEKGDTIPYTIINNYFSIGVDASIAHRFHIMREKHPEKFNNRTKNKLWYFEFGTSETLSATCKNLHEEVDILCDGKSLELATGAPLEGIALLNIPSIYGGSNLWGTSAKKKKFAASLPLVLPSMVPPASQAAATDLRHSVQDMGDKKIEVVGLDSAMQMGQVKAGLRASGRRLAQCQSVVIRTRKRFPMQLDGEPWMQPACTIHITHKNQVSMLVASKTKKHGLWNVLTGRSRKANVDLPTDLDAD